MCPRLGTPVLKNARVTVADLKELAAILPLFGIASARFYLAT